VTVAVRGHGGGGLPEGTAWAERGDRLLAVGHLDLTVHHDAELVARTSFPEDDRARGLGDLPYPSSDPFDAVGVEPLEQVDGLQDLDLAFGDRERSVQRTDAALQHEDRRREQQTLADGRSRTYVGGHAEDVGDLDEADGVPLGHPAAARVSTVAMI
jgi:hypothetical protein